MAYTPIDPTVLTGVLNNQGTQATSANQATAILLAQNGTATATVVMNDFGTLATSAKQDSQVNALTSVVNNQGTGATATNQQTQITALSAVVNNQGTLATSTGQTSQINALTSVVNNQGTGATAANQTVQVTALSAILNAQGTESTAALTPIMNDMGTLATAATQTVMMNNQGSLATAAGQTSQVNALTSVVNNQGTVATSALQTTGNSIATVIMNDFGTAATSAKQDLSNAINTVVMNAQGTARPMSMFGTGTYNGIPSVFQEVQVHQGRVQVDAALTDPTNLDAFSRLRVSNPGWRFDGQFTYQVNTDTWDSYSSSGSMAYDAVNRMVTLANNAGTNVTVLQSHYHAPYTPGRSQLALMTFNMRTAPSSGQTKRVGYFDGNNGVFLEWDATNGVSVNIASNTSNGNQRVLQGNWNIDNLNGGGPSGYTLDLTKVQIFFVSLQALYVGRVIVGFDIDGSLVPVHSFTHANKIAYPYTQQAGQPIRYELRGTNSAAANMDAICASVVSEGGQELTAIQGRQFSVSTAISGAPVTVRRPILSVRSKQTYNGVRNQVVIVPLVGAVYNNLATSLVELVRNGTITGPASTPFIDVDANSTCEYNTNGTTITGGQTIYSDYVPANAADHIDTSDIFLGRLVLAYSHIVPVNNPDTLSLVVTSTGSSFCLGTVGWKEIR